MRRVILALAAGALLTLLFLVPGSAEAIDNTVSLSGGSIVRGKAAGRKWLIFFGDSNCTGQSTETLLTSTPYRDYYSYVYTYQDNYVYLNDPIYPNSPASGRKSPWPTLAYNWMKYRKQHLSAVQACVGGSAIAMAQNPYMPVSTPECLIEGKPRAGLDGQYYCWMLLQVAELVASGAMDPDDLLGVVVIGGANDASVCYEGIHDDFEVAVEALADGIWDELGVPIIMSVLDDQDPGWPKEEDCRPEIRQAIIDAAADHEHVYLGADQRGLEFIPDNVHIQGMEEFGNRWFTVLHALFP